MALPVDGRVWHVDFDDWMYLMDDRVMLNKATMSKWGVQLGEVTLSFTRRTPLTVQKTSLQTTQKTSQKTALLAPRAGGAT
jgi:hypothetical protein